MTILTRLTRIGAACLALPLAAATVPPAPLHDQAAANRIHADVQFLASDLLEGRDTGSRGHAIAAQYVVAQFTSLGLTPGGTGGGWLVQVPLRRATHARPPQIRLLAAGKSRLLGDADVGLLPGLTQQRRVIDAGLVFVGYGVSDRELGIDEYAGLDVRGKIVVMLPGTPGSLPGDVAAHIELTKDEVAASKGAIGIAELNLVGPNPAIGTSQRPVVDWVDPAGMTGNAGSRIVSLVFSPGLSRQLFRGAARSLDQVGSSGGGPVAGFALPARLSIADDTAWQDFTSPEVVGLLPGGDPRLKPEVVVLMGHLDHIGIKPDTAPGEDSINNGALDNAAGVATLLEVARTFTQSGRPPRRSVLFIANTGEELGMLGSDFLITHSAFDTRQVVAAVNLDMPVLLYDFTDFVAYGAERSTAGRIIAGAAAGLSVKLSPDPLPQENLFVRSDHYRFVLRGIPAVLLTTGPENGGKQAWARYLKSFYHSPRDDLTQPINWQAGARYAALNYRITRALADADSRPRWYRGDYFGDVFAPGQPRAER
ncbi:MAG: M20/M25/M40 family metallo-hydrolase [Sphingomicrobium sp.]